MNMNDLLRQDFLSRLDELTEMAGMINEKAAQSILCALQGAMMSGHDGLLCNRVAQVVQQEILPAIQNAQARKN